MRGTGWGSLSCAQRHVSVRSGQRVRLARVPVPPVWAHDLLRSDVDRTSPASDTGRPKGGLVSPPGRGGCCFGSSYSSGHLRASSQRRVVALWHCGIVVPVCSRNPRWLVVVSPPSQPGFPSPFRPSKARAVYKGDRPSATVVSHHTCRNRRALTLETPRLPYIATLPLGAATDAARTTVFMSSWRTHS